MLLSNLIYPNEYTSATPVSDLMVEHISYHLNDIHPRTLFVCIKGSRMDTHSLISSLPRENVIAIVANEDAVLADTDIPILRVPSTRRTLAYLWDRFVGEPTKELTFIGITGTNGKTSTAYLLESILRACGYSTACIGTLGRSVNGIYETTVDDTRTQTMTTPDPDLLYPFLATAKQAGATHIVMEVSSHALAYEKVAPIQFADAIFTNLTPEHLDFHHTMDEYAEVKKRLFQQTDHATLNYDDACGTAIAATASYPVTRCGILWEGDAAVSQLIEDEDGCYTYFYRNGNIKQLVHLSIPGEYQVYNSALALSSAIQMGISAGDACRALTGVTYIPGRLHKVSSHADDIRVYIDFAHTEAALRSLLNTLRKSCTGRLVLLFGCGGERDTLKRPLMGRCAMELADYTIITSDNSRKEDTSSIIKDILAGHTDTTRRRVIPDREAAIRYTIMNAHKSDTIVLCGKGHEKYEIKKDGIHPFDEAAIANDALCKRRAHLSYRCTED